MLITLSEDFGIPASMTPGKGIFAAKAGEAGQSCDRLISSDAPDAECTDLRNSVTCPVLAPDSIGRCAIGNASEAMMLESSPTALLSANGSIIQQTVISYANNVIETITGRRFCPVTGYAAVARPPPAR